MILSKNNTVGPPKHTIVRWITTVIPIIDWLPRYQSAWLWSDLIAGLTLAAYAVPIGMAYSALAGLTPQAGLYCYIFGGIAYALFASSRHLAIGPTAAISLMVASVAGTVAGGDAALYAAMAALTAGAVALIFFFAWLLRLSTFVSFISETILLGFKAGAAFTIAATQLPKLFGVPGGGDYFFDRIIILTRQLGDTNLTVLMFGIGTLIVLALGEHLFPGRPVALLVVVLAISAVSVFGLADSGLTFAGLVPAGLPTFGIPVIGAQHLEEVVALAFACFLLSYIESISAARTFALKYRYTVDPRQELLALGAANLAAALGQGYPVAGGLSQSAVNERGGARTPLALIFSSVMLTVVLLFLTGLLRNLPEVVLAAIVIVAVAGFIKASDFKRLWHISRLEFSVALVAFASVLLLGILKGVMISAVASILFLLRQMANPNVAILGRIPGTQRFSDLARHQDNESIPGILIFRVEAPLLYFNVENIDKTVLEHVHVSPTPVKLVVCDLSSSPYIDVSGAQMLAELQEQLEKKGIQFRVAEAHSEVRDIVRATGVDQQLGGVSRFTSILDVVNEFDNQQQ